MMDNPAYEKEYHILIIDDNDTFIPIIRQGFSLWQKKNRLSFAQTISLAQQIISSDPPDIVFIAMNCITDDDPFFLDENTLLPYPVVIIADPDEEEQAKLSLKFSEFDHLTRTDRSLLDIPQICDRSLRELRQITARLSAEYRLARKDEEISGRDEELSTQLEEMRNANTLLQQSELRFRQLFDENVAGYALHEIICNSSGNPTDYRFLEINPAFERLTGLRRENITGKTVLEVLPGTESFWIETYGRVALTGQSENFENFSRELNRYYEVTAYSPEKGKFATLVLDVTKRKRADIALQKSEELLRLTLHATNDGIWDWNLQTGKAYFSPRWYSMLGYEADEIPSTYATLRSLIHPDDLIRIEKEIQNHISRKDEGYSAEIRMLTKQNAYMWILTRGSIVERAEDGTPIRMVGTHTDISDRKRIEEELAQKHSELMQSYEQIAISEEELRQNLQELADNEHMLQKTSTELQQIFNNMINAFIIWESVFDENGNYVSFRFGQFNEAFARIAKLRSEDVKGKDVFEVWPATEKSWVEAYGRVAVTGIPCVFDMYHDPTSGWYHCNVYRPTESPDRVCVIFEDITERKKMEDSIRETNSYLENLINSANVPIIVWDASFKITRFNRASETLTGRSAEDVIGQPLDILFPPARKDHSMRLIHTTMDGVRWDTVEIEIQHVSGINKTVIWNSSTIYSSDGITPVATIAQGQDITEQKKLEGEKEVALAQIQQNLAQLSILNDGVRNPLTVITLIAESYKENTGADTIMDQVRRIDEMIRQLDIRWVESKNVLSFLRKHYMVSMNDQLPGDTGTNVPAKPGDTAHPLIQEVQAELFTILDSIDALVYVADMNTHELLFMNKRGRSRFGNVIGKKCYEIIQQDQNGVCPFCTNYLLTGPAGPTGEYQWEFFNKKNGRWYDCRDRAIRWGDGRIVRLEIATDITIRKQAEDALRLSETRYRQIVENENEAILVAQDGMLKLINTRMTELTGYSEKELLFQPFIDIIYPDDREMVKEMHYKRLAGENPPSHYPFRLKRKDGAITWVEISSVLIEWEGSQATLNFLIDITGKRQAEEALLESNKKLRLLTGLTRHDIFNKASAAQLYADLAMRSSDIAQVHKYASLLKEANERIETITRFTREYEDFGVVFSGWQRIHMIIESAKGEVTVGNVVENNQIPTNLEVYADPIIRKVFTTLIENAVRHGGVVTCIRFTSHESDGSLIISCEDDGKGIPGDEKEIIFEKDYGDHTGIGLFLAREILSITGLSIRESGVPGKGARFEILVPQGKFRSVKE